MADDLPFSKISISGPTLSSLLHHSLSSSSPLTGFLFGHVTSLPSPDPTDSDPSPSSSSSSSLHSLTITSFISSPLPFFDSLGRLQNPNPNPNSPSSSLIGWFSSRPLSPLRPSMRELAASNYLSQTPTLTPLLRSSPVFLILSSHFTANHAVHTHEYRAFLLFHSSLKPISLDVVNVGPKFRGQYGAFSPESSLGFPLLPCRVMDEGGESRAENGEGRVSGEWDLEGFTVERLEGLVGESAEMYKKELEDLYSKTMVKLERLVRMVEESSARVQEQV